MNRIARLAAIPLAFLLIGAAPQGRFIPLPDDPSEGLIIPPDSPVQFRYFDKYGRAHFSGRFVLAGRFILACDLCEPHTKITEKDLGVTIVPDPALAARLPHWKVVHNDMGISVSREMRLIRTIGSPNARATLLSGAREEIKGRIAIIVDDFQTGIECDSANYSARFISMAKSPMLAQMKLNGNYGCA